MAGQEIKKPLSTKGNRISLFKSLNVMFYFSRIIGVCPFSFTEYFNKKVFKISILGNVWLLCIAVNHTVQYHIAIANSSFGEKNASPTDTNTLTMVIGIFIVYMEPFMMSIDTIASIFNQRRLIVCLTRLVKVDERLANENIYVQNKRIQTITIVCLVFTLLCEMGLVLFNYFLQFQISDDFILQMFWWFCTGLPIFTNSVARVWYIILVLVVRERFNVINEYFADAQESFKRTKTKYNSFSQKNRSSSAETVGYLSKEITGPKNSFSQIGLAKRETKPPPSFKSNKIHIINPPAALDQKTADAEDKSVADSFFVFGNENEFTIGNKLDKKLVELCRIHDELCEIAKSINQMYSFQILLTMAYGFMSVTAQFYFLYCGLVGQAIPILFRSAESIMISIIYISYTTLKCVSVIFVSWKTKLVAQKTGIHLHKVANVIDENHFYYIVNHLSLKLLNNQLVFTACGFFDLDMTTIYAVGRIFFFLTVVLYIYISIFHISDHWSCNQLLDHPYSIQFGSP